VDPAGGNTRRLMISSQKKEHALKGKGSKRERETTINYNEAEANASIWTASETMYGKLLKLGYRPTEESDRSATFQVPKRLWRCARPARSRPHSKEFRKFRESIEYSQAMLSREIDVSIHGISRWENDEVPIPKIAELALRYIVEKHQRNRDANGLQGQSEPARISGFSALFGWQRVLGRYGM
jgi:DNA-binding XRE family transcriptional regulator